MGSAAWRGCSVVVQLFVSVHTWHLWQIEDDSLSKDMTEAIMGVWLPAVFDGNASLSPSEVNATWSLMVVVTGEAEGVDHTHLIGAMLDYADELCQSAVAANVSGVLTPTAPSSVLTGAAWGRGEQPSRLQLGLGRDTVTFGAAVDEAMLSQGYDDVLFVMVEVKVQGVDRLYGTFPEGTTASSAVVSVSASALDSATRAWQQVRFVWMR